MHKIMAFSWSNNTVLILYKYVRHNLIKNAIENRKNLKNILIHNKIMIIKTNRS
jgi:hypothetical protein